MESGQSRIDRIIVNKELKEEITKNQSNMSFVYESTNELQQLADFKNSIFDKVTSPRHLKAKEMYQSYEHLKSLKLIDRKTEKIIEKLKD